MAENFFKSLKSELIYHRRFKNQTQAKLEIFGFIEVWYNRQRLHTSLDYKTPVQMENEFYNNQKVAA